MADEDRRRFRDEAERGGRARGGGVEDSYGGAVGRRGEGDESRGHSGYDDDRGSFIDDYHAGPGSGTVNAGRRRGSGLGAFGFNDDARQENSHRGRGPRGYQRPDERILEDVSDRLTDDPHVDASKIEVRVENREVTLNGTVASRFEKRHAEDIAESTPGVTHVQNNLRVQMAERNGGLDAVSATGAGSGRTGTLGPAGGTGSTGSIGGRRTGGSGDR
jgi:hypothetical protein